MAVRRSQNWLNQQRVDVPHLRSIESAVRNDFDELLSSFAIGESASYIIRGFEINMVGAIGASASSLQMIVEKSSLFHGKSAQSGTFFQIVTGTPNQTINSTTNTRVQGSFTPTALNYVGLEFTRAVDNATTAQVFLWNPTNKNEVSKTVPLAETLDYKIVVTSSLWASNVLPIAIIETDSSNNVASVEDRRPMLFRLGTAGTNTPDPFHVYPWTNHTEGRTENFWKSTSSVSPFKGGDKQILQFKEWADAVMSRFAEIIGSAYWYSENKAGSLLKIKGDLDRLQMTGSGKFTHAETTAGRINWSSDIYLNYIGSRLRYKILSNVATSHITMSDDQAVYLDFVRGVGVIPNLIFTNASATVSSVGAVSWTSDVIAGDYIKVGSEDDTKYYEILTVNTASQVTLTSAFQESSTGSGGVQAKYAWGTYQTSATPTTNRHLRVVNRKDVPFDEDIYWLFLRADNGGSTARVYIRGSSGGELQQGEDREISDNQTIDVLEYIGSPAEVDTTPDYTNALGASVAEQRTITFPAASALTSGQYFKVNSSLNLNKYYVWANISGGGGDPAPGGLIGVEVAILSGDSAVVVAGKYQAILDALPYFDSVDNLDGTITLNNSQVGVADNATNVDMGVGFSISTSQEGTGAFNHVIIDDENLTKAIKRLDESIGIIQDVEDVAPYEEPIAIIAAAPSNPDQEITGPVAASTSVKIPKNTRDSSIQMTYVVGAADLAIMLNGYDLVVGKDYTEIGTPGTDSTTITFTFQLEIGDYLLFRKIAGVGSTSGGSGTASGLNLGSAQDADVFKQSIGSQLQFRRLIAGANMTITQDANYITLASSSGVGLSNIVSIIGANYTLTSANDVVFGTNSGANRTFTLPDATTVEGKIFNIKKIDAGNILYVKSVSAQELDGVDIDAAPLALSVQYENVTIIASAGKWWLL